MDLRQTYLPKILRTAQAFTLKTTFKLTRSDIYRWEKDEEERRIKEEGKREKTALATWRKLLMGLRIIQRVREEYGGDVDGAHSAEEVNPFTNPSRARKALEADTWLGPTLTGVPFSYIEDKDIGGGFLAEEDDPDGGGLLPKGHDAVEVRRRAGQLTIEDEKAPVGSDSLSGSPSADFDVMNCGLPNTDNREGVLTEAALDDKITVPRKTPTNRKKAAATVTGSEGKVSTNLVKRRAAPKRRAARKSETALRNHFSLHESDEDDNSDGEIATSKEIAVKRSARGKNNKDGSGPSRKRSCKTG